MSPVTADVIDVRAPDEHSYMEVDGAERWLDTASRFLDGSRLLETPISSATADHYVWGAQCDGWHLVRAIGLSVIQERMPPGTSEVRHRHAKARQFFFVLNGELTLEVAGAVHVLSARTGLEIAPGVAHQALNRSAASVEFLVVSNPPSHGDRQLDIER